MRAIGVREFVFAGLAGFDLERHVGFPETFVRHVHLDLERDRLGRVVRNEHALMVIAGHQVRIGWRTGFHDGVLPRAADTDGLAQLPKVVDRANPEAEFAIS